MYKKYKLSNGTRVILAPQKNTKAATVLVLYGVGSRYEKESEAGISHFLEHVVFKGTTKRPNTLEISRELDAIGAKYNAFTGKDHTGYYVKANAEHLGLAVEILSDMLFNSKFESQEIKREKGTIIEEINMFEDNPSFGVNLLLDNIVFKNNSLSRDEGGTKKTVSAVTRAKIINYRNTHYRPENCAIVIAGNVDNQKARRIIEKYFGGEAKKKKKPDFEKFKEFQKAPQIKLKYKKTEQVHLVFGFTGPKATDKDFMATQILSVILGGSMSSRLFINIRERYGLCYYIRSSFDSYHDVGLFSITAGLDKKRIFLAINLILKELRKIKQKGITKEELKKAQEFLKGHIILEMEDSAAVAEWFGRQEILVRQTKTPEQKIAEVMKVTKNKVDAIARKIFQTEKLNLALIGPYRDDKKFKKLLKI
ncbi:MAG: pitrilysin family protein [Patescibacteria group bacterium]|nr:pitrilysin family protein [Patescibacteria group bacterium]